jgi:peptidoglycan/xylan/chitin deacetylase (PgdA/CDA1 family)
MLTFDDGYLCTYQNAFPVMQDLGFTAVIFLVTDFSRRANWRDFKDRAMRAPLLEPRHIYAMKETGIEFGSHSVNHSSLPCLADHHLVDELARSKQILESITNESVSMLAYPYGDVNDRVKNAVRTAGYSCAFAVNSGPLNFYADAIRYQLIVTVF